MMRALFLTFWIMGMVAVGLYCYVVSRGVDRFAAMLTLATFAFFGAYGMGIANTRDMFAPEWMSYAVFILIAASILMIFRDVQKKRGRIIAYTLAGIYTILMLLFLLFALFV